MAIFVDTGVPYTITYDENGDPYVYAPMTSGQIFHLFIVTLAIAEGMVALGFGLATFAKRPCIPHLHIVHRNLGRWWVFLMTIAAFQSAVRTFGQLFIAHFSSDIGYSLQFIVETGTPIFIVILVVLMYVFMILGHLAIRVRGDMKEFEFDPKTKQRALMGLKAWHRSLATSRSQSNFDLLLRLPMR